MPSELKLPTLDELLPPYPPLSPEGIAHADDAVRFLELLPQSKGRQWYGKRLELIGWQRRFTRELFGRRDPATGLRRYRTCFVGVPKKQGKSTLAAGFVLKLTIADQEYGAECYGAAYDKDQAKIVYEVAQAMVELNPELARMCRVKASKSLIEFPRTRSKYAALAHDTEGSHGFNIHGLVIDEFHTWTDAELYRTLDFGTAAREQPLTIIITTAGVYDPELECLKQWEYARGVRDGLIDDPTFLPVLFETPKDDAGEELLEWDDPVAWHHANPSLGITVPVSYLETKARKAQHMASEVLDFRRLHLNQWTAQLKGWLSMKHWKRCGELDFREEDFYGLRAWLGVDLADTHDLTAISIVIPLDDETLAIPVRVFCPDQTIATRTKRDRVPYDAWAKAGYLRVTQGPTTDYAAIRQEVHELAGKFEVEEVCSDPWNALQLMNELVTDGFRVVKIPQSAAHISNPAKELERAVTEVRVRHGGNPVLTWCAANATVRTDSNGNIKPDKSRSRGRIDPIVATVNGIYRAVCGKVERPKWLITSG